MSTIKAEKIDVTFKAGKVLVDIDLASCACTFDLTLSECVMLIEKLAQAVLDASMALPDRRSAYSTPPASYVHLEQLGRRRAVHQVLREPPRIKLADE